MALSPSKQHIHFGLLVFAVVAAAFGNLYITQPVLPVLATDFNTTAGAVSITVSAVVAGLALANIPWGILADRHRIGGILFAGGALLGLAGIAGYFTTNLEQLAVTRFIQGLALPAMLTCVAAYLGRVLPPEKLNVVMGAYISATVIGGLSSRLLGGWAFPESHWREALLFVAIMGMLVTWIAAWRLPDEGHSEEHHAASTGFMDLLFQATCLRMFLVGFTGFFVFQSTFNYLPFRLSAEPLNLSTFEVTAVYFSYAAGAIMGPVSGLISNRLGNGLTIALGSIVLGLGIAMTLIDSVWIIVLGLFVLCVGFFSLHSSAVGALNSRLKHGKGRANALYVMAYYIGGFTGITLCGWIYEVQGWDGLILTCLVALLLPLTFGLFDHKAHSA